MSIDEYYNKTYIKMKNLIAIVLGTLLIPSISVFGQTNSVRNYKMPVQDRKVVKTQEIAINKSNASVSNSFDSPQNYKHQVFNKNQENQDLLVLRTSTEKVQTGINPLESPRNYKSPVFSRAVQKEINKEQLAVIKE
ncbi:MAG: hypothetical protein CFE22_07060 [Cytophagaceae bacterium BCCC1]|nr:MAG: hypothetical protein CFE22_07060 [Cytophagaceae bacterium BCCC1]